jgi:hypothetical protein
MKMKTWAIGLVAAVAGMLGAQSTHAADDIVIGDIDDLSGTYADVSGP